MSHLWAPWRMAYIKGERTVVDGCIFCKALEAEDAEAHILHRSQHAYAILNRFPYNNGHLMIIPYAHVATQEALPPDALLDIMQMVNHALAALRKAYNPPAFNLGANIGAAAGAGIAEHYHFHVVPRWAGDANFMTAVGDTRVIPASLDETWRDLRAAWER
jgi:ATP adenylyltransferase